MRISIRTLEGNSIDLDVQLDDQIKDIKDKIQDKKRIRTDLQRLMYKDEQLKNDRTLASYGICDDSILHLVLRAQQKSNIVAGGYGEGSATHQLSFPYGLCAADDRTIVIADWGNHRIVQWEVGGDNGVVIAGGHGQGNQPNQLNCPTDVLIDNEDNSLIISDHGNRRVLRWPRHPDTNHGEVILNNIACWGLAIDKQRRLYVSDVEKGEVRRYEMGQSNGKLVAGGHGSGVRRKQLSKPLCIFVDEQEAVYVSDTMNYRVMKWEKDAEEGSVVLHGCSRGLFVDQTGTIYIADYGNHRILRWPKDAKEGIVMEAENSHGEEEQKLYLPWSVFVNQQ
ncbi:unnamed protein product, partial [Rotaria magnacalcarata]